MHKLELRFTGSGSEYFRIWIVNLLLIFVTLGIYYPWAKARRLRYFHQNTLVGSAEIGMHAMDFHGNPKAMLRGQLLAIGLFGLYSVAAQFSAIGAVVALIALAGLAPVLFNTALRFRLSNTSWRGMRFHFTGATRDAYRAVLPAYAPGALLMAVPLLIAIGSAGSATVAGTTAASAVNVATVVLLLVGLLMLPWCLQQIKRFQHDHYAFGYLQTGFDAKVKSFYWLFLKPITLVIGVLVGLGAIAFAAGATDLVAGKSARSDLILGLLSLVPFVIAMILMVTLKPYLVASLQNLVWSHTRNDRIQFESHLRLMPLVLLTMKNWLLLVLTLGLYMPFATVAVTRMRLAAVSLATRDHPDEIVNLAMVDTKGATGDAATDLFGLDIGL